MDQNEVTKHWSIFQISNFSNFGPFFKFLGNQGELKRFDTTKILC